MKKQWLEHGHPVPMATQWQLPTVHYSPYKSEGLWGKNQDPLASAEGPIPYSTAPHAWIQGGQGKDTTGEKPLPCFLEETLPYLLLHSTLQQHRHTSLDGEGDLAATDHEVLLQGLPKGRLLDPGL
jgi:hypothetical protein